MSDTITKITKVEITGLWGRFDLTWKLNPDVNVLSGINGSGKSTILGCVATFLKTGSLGNKYPDLVNSIKIVFNDNNNLPFGYFNTNETITNLEQKALKSDVIKEIVDSLKEKEGSNYDNFKKENQKVLIVTKGADISHLQIDLLNTFDVEIPEATIRPDKQVKTELDRDIFRFQKEYLEYQLNISKKKDILAETEDNPKAAIAELRQPQLRFLEIIDDLFSGTGKKVNRADNEISFFNGDTELSAYQLSSGEKQMLVILMMTLIQDNKPAILFLDEPEISLHFDWQKKLIQYIRELNPNVQIILATHSPAVVMEGWLDKVQEVSDLITLDRAATKK